jgi:ribosomal protein S18 acetylase RimI-like enzyme
MNFKKYDEEAARLIDLCLEGTDYCGSDYSFYSFMCWFEELEYAQTDDALYLRTYFNGALRYWTPLLKKGSKLTIKQAVEALPPGCSFAFATENFKNEMSEEYVFCTNRSWSEYVYGAANFIALAGKRYSGKRNHIKRFLSKYTPEMSPYKAEDATELEAFERAWRTAHDFEQQDLNESAEKEFKLSKSAFEASLSGKTVCDVLRIDGKIAGVAVAEFIASGNAVVLHEKADISYEGIYSYLANEFAKRHLSGCRYINRQEDMGLEGLRKSKMSYNPEFLLDKYVLTPKADCIIDKGTGEYRKPCEGDSSLEFEEEDDIRAVAGLLKTTDREEAVSEAISILRERFRSAPLSDYTFRQLKENDFNKTMSFFKCGIAHLKNKLFFMNYTDEELLGVLKDGYMLGAFYGGNLVATCGIDCDKAFGDKLAEICGDNTGRQFFELSGIMVCPYHQKKGLANAITAKAVEYAKENLNYATLCATVQFDNAASLGNLKKLGFAISGEAKYKEYDFRYLTLEIN